LLFALPACNCSNAVTTLETASAAPVAPTAPPLLRFSNFYYSSSIDLTLFSIVAAYVLSNLIILDKSRALVLPRTPFNFSKSLITVLKSLLMLLKSLLPVIPLLNFSCKLAISTPNLVVN
jgi:hypothetical protein